jgi:hypothetical protein
MFSVARLTVYIVALLSGIGMVLHAWGVATYDQTAGTIDLAPININWLAAAVATIIAPAIAAVANWRKWR